MKLSEALAKLGIKPEELEDDEVNLPLPEVRKRLKENQSGFTRATQERAELQKRYEEDQQRWNQQLEQWQNRDQQWQNYQRGIEAQMQELKNAAVARQQQATQAGMGQLDPWTDPVLAPLRGEWDRLGQQLQQANQQRQQEMQQIGQVHQALSKGLVGLAQEFAQAREYVGKQFERLEVDRMKQRYGEDFDEERVRSAAKKFGINDWEGAYQAERGERFPSALESAKKAARDEAFREAETKFKGTGSAPTELGGSGGPSAPVPPEPKKDYESAWKGLEKDFQELGFGGGVSSG